MRSHAAVPVAEHVEGDVYRVYFSSRNLLNQSHTGYVVMDILRPTQILDMSHLPVLSPGKLGEFDDSGAMGTWLVKTKSTNLLYYVGWNVGVTVPFRNSIGLSIGNAETGYSRYAPGPILDRSMNEPHFCASCCVIPGEDYWRMWYLSCTEWEMIHGKPRHKYHIKYAESDDGIRWRREGVVAIDFSNDGEYAISRPSVVRRDGTWKMWYSHRGHAYRIGYAESEDGKKWIRRDEMSGISTSSFGWDSEMIEYPFVFDHKGQLYMFYNGNGYGMSGFGLAVME